MRNMSTGLWMVKAISHFRTIFGELDWVLNCDIFLNFGGFSRLSSPCSCVAVLVICSGDLHHTSMNILGWIILSMRRNITV